MKGFGWLHAVAALAVTVTIGCGATVGDEGEGEGEGEEGDAVGEVEQTITGGGGCCSVGYYRCPSTGEVYEYSAPGCGDPLRTAARLACNGACSVTCVDSGWHTSC